MKMMKLSIALIFFLSSLSGFSAFCGAKGYTSVFKKNVQRNTANDFKSNLTQDVQSFLNILRNKKVVAVLTTAQKPANSSKKETLALKLK
ncbi:MAG: hypothetical protein OXB86_00815 [Bdellovibrionales bacterium]|nr:hypothetical protein [Bdellovibrionales bacterium]